MEEELRNRAGRKKTDIERKRKVKEESRKEERQERRKKRKKE